jgi:hypothetical protein
MIAGNNSGEPFAHASLNRTALGQLFTDLVSPGAATTGVAQAKRIA